MTDQTPDPWVNSKGHLVPDSMVSETDKLTEATIDTIFGFGEKLMAQIARFRDHSFDDIGALQELLGEKYGLQKGGRKGNVSFVSYDGCRKIEVRIADNVIFGPELQIAKALIDEYIEEVSTNVPDELRVLLTNAFETDKPGYVNRSALYAMRRWPIHHPKWVRAMDAISDSMRTIGSKEHFVLSTRPTPQDGWKALPINLTNAYQPEAKDGDDRGEGAAT